MTEKIVGWDVENLNKQKKTMMESYGSILDPGPSTYDIFLLEAYSILFIHFQL